MAKKNKAPKQPDRRQFDESDYVKHVAKRKRPEVKEKPKYNHPKHWLAEADEDELE